MYITECLLDVQYEGTFNLSLFKRSYDSDLFPFFQIVIFSATHSSLHTTLFCLISVDYYSELRVAKTFNQQ